MVYIPEIKKDVWPLYTPPYTDELFSSWFFRISQAHQIKSHTFGRIYFENHSFWNRDVDLLCPTNVSGIIEKNTPLSIIEINNLFLKSFEGYLFENINNAGFTIGISSLKMYHRKRKGYGLLFCPNCLNQKSYYKKSWRIFYSIACTNCAVLLNDHCFNCKSPIAFHRLEQGKRDFTNEYPLNTCYHCLKSLSAYTLPASDIQVNYQKQIDNYIDKGFTTKLSYSHLYFEMLYKIATLISRESKIWGRLRDACCSEFGTLPKITNKYFYLTNLDERREILIIAFQLLENEHLFRRIIEKHNIRMSEFTKDRRIPFYYENIIKTSL